MEPALPSPLEDWAAAPAPARKPMRLYLPGDECLARLVSGALPAPGGSTTTRPPRFRRTRGKDAARPAPPTPC